MTLRIQPSDLEIASLISSKICHDAINPVSAISHGLQMLDDGDADNAKFAMDMIRNVTAQASARIEFARVAFGASGPQTVPIDLGKAQDIVQRYVSPTDANGRRKHRLIWNVPAAMVEKDKGKLLLNMIAAAISALPRGGEIQAVMTGTTAKPQFVVRCVGTGAKVPDALAKVLSGTDGELDAMNIQYYYMQRLTDGAGMTLDVVRDGADVIFSARMTRTT
jgi:histidine phosphotransferase ChpT